jgi:asparagine synthase (glutamine-hydrolysing)
MVSDVPVGVFLSGGLDSTAVLAAARDAYDGPLRTFTVVFPGTSLDESALARRAAAQFGTDHVEVHVSGDQFFANIDRFFDVMDEPTIDGANTYIVAQAAHEAGLKVVLSGLGADELLGGYASFVRVPQIRRLVAGLDRVPGGCATAAWIAAHTPDPRAPKMAELLGGPARSLVEVWRSYRALFSRAHLRALVGTGPVESGMADRAETNDWFWDVARLEVEEFMCPQLLRDSDAFTMTWGVELRTPFVDHMVLSAVRDTVRWRREGRASYKATLFRHMRELVPETHLDRPKQGFVLPLEEWLRRALDGSARPDKALAAVCAEPRYRFAIDLFRRRRLHWSRIWALYVLERFGRGRDEPIPDRAPT